MPEQTLALDPPQLPIRRRRSVDGGASHAADNDNDANLQNYRAGVVELFNSETGHLSSLNLTCRLIRPLLSPPPHAVQAAVAAVGAAGGAAGSRVTASRTAPEENSDHSDDDDSNHSDHGSDGEQQPDHHPNNVTMGQSHGRRRPPHTDAQAVVFPGLPF